MADAVGCGVVHFLYEDSRWPTIALGSWRGCLPLVLALPFFGLDVVACKAVEPPTIAELRQAHSELRKASSNVQGEIHTYRSETVILAALEKLPSDIGIPLIRSGNVWRSEERMRADFTSYHSVNGAAKESQNSVALDGGKAYEFVSGLTPDTGILRISDRDTTEAAVVVELIERIFLQPLDALWRSGDVAFVDFLQRPGTKIVPNGSQLLRGGYSLLVVSPNDDSEHPYELEPAKNHPFGYVVASSGDGNSLVKIARRVLSNEKEGAVFPTRVVSVVSIGPDSGYTEVVMLNLEPLAASSPMASDITRASFQEFGTGYQVYRFRSSDEQELAERYERPATISPNSGSNLRRCFLWVNGFVVLALLAYVTYRRTTRR